MPTLPNYPTRSNAKLTINIVSIYDVIFCGKVIIAKDFDGSFRLFIFKSNKLWK